MYEPALHLKLNQVNSRCKGFFSVMFVKIVHDTYHAHRYARGLQLLYWLQNHPGSVMRNIRQQKTVGYFSPISHG